MEQGAQAQVQYLLAKSERLKALVPKTEPTNARFTQFSNMPRELRKEIWHAACYVPTVDIVGWLA
ncbi:hypothetical protein HYFRA_00013164 [Hymenoscyphus fraxineus]|uniref:2EXR domain-containing protein n=1 Tax=Hymenoscyphus fraxineus TaxID=746836 RepID=A0A9N9LAE4_9HELO|nr:hypothetical protein HYFRA_00013164 [Hymenoscyphus fraxineus]